MSLVTPELHENAVGPTVGRVPDLVPDLPYRWLK